MKKRISLSMVVVAIMIVTGMWNRTYSQDPHIQLLEPGTVPIHLRVVFQQNPSSQATVSWTTTEKGSSSVVYYDTEPRNGEIERYRYRTENVTTGSYTLRSEEEGMDSWYHHSVLDDLEPSTTYYLVVETDGDRTREHYFITAAEDDRDIALLVGGDSRIGSQRTEPDSPRRRMNNVMATLLEKHPHILALAHTADYTNRAYWSQLYYWLKDHYEMTTTRDGRLLPILPSRGNHDTDVGFEEAFNWPGEEGVDTYYASQLGENVAVVVLNTEISRSGDQRIWLEKKLAELRPRNRWLMAFYHRPAYPSVRSYDSGEGTRRSWVPLFEEFNVNIVAEGHDHSLKRTVPIRGNERHSDGLVYIGDGGLGVSPREVESDRWYLQNPGISASVHNVHMLEFTQEAIHGWGYSIDGEVLDEFLIPADREERMQYFDSLMGSVVD